MGVSIDIPSQLSRHGLRDRTRTAPASASVACSNRGSDPRSQLAIGDLASRGLRTDQTMLVVLDGAKALRKAVKDVFGERALIQRCQERKRRNVADQLPETMRKPVRRAMKEAYRCRDAKRARRLLDALAERLHLGLLVLPQECPHSEPAGT
jgi:hypothetical protein